MANARYGAELRRVDTLFGLGAVGQLADGHLLERFTAGAGHTADLAFAALVERHGPMVLRVCQSVLREPHESQDAFQATFLILAMKAGSIHQRHSLASWLHGVAYRVAESARASAARRRRHERKAAEMRATLIENGDQDWADRAAVVHEEINRLPMKYRAAIVLCYLEGRTHEQAAALLDWPVGTVRSRLARARDRLRRGLVRRGLTPVATLALDRLAREATSAILPPALAQSASRVASLLAANRMTAAGVVSASIATLAKRALGELLWIRLKTASLLVVAIGLSLAQASRGNQETVGRSGKDSPLPTRVMAQAEPDLLELTGRTAYDPDAVTKIRPRFDTLVEKVHAGLGQTIKKGDRLVQLHSTELAAAKSDFQGKYVQWQHDLKLYNLRKELVKTGEVSPQHWVDTQNDEEKSRLDYILARDRLKIWKVPDEEIKLLLTARKGGLAESVKAKLTLFSPLDGIVIEREAEPRNYYAASSVLMVVAPLDRLWVFAEVPEKYQPRLKKGQTVWVEIPFQKQEIEAKVEFAAKEVLRDTRTVKFRCSIPNPGSRLKGGMLVRLRLMLR